MLSLGHQENAYALKKSRWAASTASTRARKFTCCEFTTQITPECAENPRQQSCSSVQRPIVWIASRRKHFLCESLLCNACYFRPLSKCRWTPHVLSTVSPTPPLYPDL